MKINHFGMGLLFAYEQNGLFCAIDFAGPSEEAGRCNKTFAYSFSASDFA